MELRIVLIWIVEVVKYINNVWYVFKISFVNEIGNICKEVGIDGYVVMDVFCVDNWFNIFKVYFKSGFVFGGFCFFKDLCVLCFVVWKLDVLMFIFDVMMDVNEE